MADRLKLTLAQLNPTVGDVAANAALVRQAYLHAAGRGSDVVVTTELALSGYPPEDLIYRPAFLDLCDEHLRDLKEMTAAGGPALIVGAPVRQDGKVYNGAVVLDRGEVVARVLKQHLPNYGVFDEIRVFATGPAQGPVRVRGVRLGILICEDMWFTDVAETLAETGAEILVIPNGSPFELDKPDQRLSHAVARVSETGLPLVYVNQVGGQDELVFDGSSFVLGADHSLRLSMAPWVAHEVDSDWTRGSDGRWTCTEQTPVPAGDRLEQIYQAMVVGLRDYVQKNGFPGVLLGLSGGIDSALSAAVAVDALGADKVHCVMMPSPYTSRDSLEDAAECARLLGCRLDEINIGPAMAAYDSMLSPFFAGRAPDITEENIQSRARGMTLMGLSNKFGAMVLSTGNKSEMSVGYATLYGDMCGGYSVLKDVYKTDVFVVSRWRNAHRPTGARGPEGMVMPERVITKPPSAELRPDQKDEDSLPPYDVLDDILFGLVEGQKSVSEVVATQNHDPATVERVWRLLNRAEYKRRQAPPGVKIGTRAFGRERRYPITNAYIGPR
ncbi:NAD+ synthase [Insolitispirillum peregrinum]|uniref:Glutamine-dependent NAD(+) synthetase n=1 Tax=Insolitispirillum peregrinum TaxID=80876 RepID=A0A1N7NIM9_9PROT|nr:NAD+ synthase [Insolitispirillum peregrinum]SIS98245.1 NH(3)-dependent NAD(+) synthetase [Insolitispirillum peregrinum]